MIVPRQEEDDDPNDVTHVVETPTPATIVLAQEATAKWGQGNPVTMMRHILDDVVPRLLASDDRVQFGIDSHPILQQWVARVFALCDLSEGDGPNWYFSHVDDLAKGQPAEYRVNT